MLTKKYINLKANSNTVSARYGLKKPKTILTAIPTAR